MKEVVTILEAINHALDYSLKVNKNVVLLGQDTRSIKNARACRLAYPVARYVWKTWTVLTSDTATLLLLRVTATTTTTTNNNCCGCCRVLAQ